MRLIRWFRAEWARSAKSDEWMADELTPRTASRYTRWAIRTQGRSNMLFGLFLVAWPVLLALFLFLAVLVFLVVQLIDALT
jgi:hypothetical protein